MNRPANWFDDPGQPEGSVRRLTGRQRIGRALLAISLTGYSMPPVHALETLPERLERLSLQHQFVIEGEEKLLDEPSSEPRGNLVEQVKGLLTDYNFAMTLKGASEIELIRITSHKRAGPPRSAHRGTIETLRVGAHQQVQAMLVGPNRVAQRLPLLIDTGASTVVLPNSMMSTLGFEPGDLQEGVSKTANGTVPIKLGVLDSVSVGSAEIANVQVSFIADDKMQGSNLLGMSFLGHFRMTLDENQIELRPRE